MIAVHLHLHTVKAAAQGQDFPKIGIVTPNFHSAFGEGIFGKPQ